MTPILYDILASRLAAEPGITLIPESDVSEADDGATSDAAPDVRLTGAAVGSNRRHYEALLRRHPGLSVFSIASAHSGTCGWTLRLQGEPLGDGSADELIEAARRALTGLRKAH